MQSERKTFILALVLVREKHSTVDTSRLSLSCTIKEHVFNYSKGKADLSLQCVKSHVMQELNELRAPLPRGKVYVTSVNKTIIHKKNINKNL